MSGFLQDLAARRRFGIKPGLDTIRALCSALGNPQRRLRSIHIAGTNGKGAVAAILDSCLRTGGFRVGRYTSPHLVRINERFMLDGNPVPDDKLEKYSKIVQNALAHWGQTPQNQGLSPSDSRGQSPVDVRGQSPNLRGQSPEVTFFEALTAVAFALYADESPDFVVLETGLGGRLDATNICEPVLSVITRIGLDHCDWLGDTVEKIAAEKAGIIKPGVPVVLGANAPEVVAVVKARAEELGSPFIYAPEIADESEIPKDFSLKGLFNRENAVTALAALSSLGTDPIKPLGTDPIKPLGTDPKIRAGFSKVVWPGRFQTVGRFIVDGAHNPPAARALAAALQELVQPQDPMGTVPTKGTVPKAIMGTVPNAIDQQFTLIAGFCADKDVDETLAILAPFVRRAIAVRTNNPRSLSPEELTAKMKYAGMEAEACDSVRLAIERVGSVPMFQAIERAGTVPMFCTPRPDILICGSLFLAGEALVALGAYPWPADRFDLSELPKDVNGNLV